MPSIHKQSPTMCIVAKIFIHLFDIGIIKIQDQHIWVS